MHFPLRPLLDRRSAAGTAAALVATMIALETYAVPASAAQRPAFSFTARPVRNAPHGTVSFTPFISPPVADAGDDLTVGPDGNIWLTVSGNGTIVRMTPQGVSTAFQYASSGQSLSITPGPDGALWFTDIVDDLVGKVTTAGVVTTYPLPTNIQNGCELDATMPLGITAGPDGAMWFTVSEGAGGSLSCPAGQLPEIGRITTSGAMTFYPVPDIIAGGLCSPTRITAGPDGRLWFTNNTDQNGATLGVGSITTAGAVTLGNGFPGAVQSHDDDYLTFGADHNLYVADTFDGTIIRVSNYGAGAIFHVPGGVHPYGIVRAPGGTLAFSTDADGIQDVGLMTLGGRFALLSIPSSFGDGYGGGMAFRSKSQLWFPNNGSHGSANVVEATYTP